MFRCSLYTCSPGLEGRVASVAVEVEHVATVTEVAFAYGATAADDRECVVGRAGYQGVWSQSPARWPTQVATVSVANPGGIGYLVLDHGHLDPPIVNGSRLHRLHRCG